MTVGLFINGRRPVSKAQVKQAVRDGQEVVLENTSWFGDGQNRLVTELAVGESVSFVGPNPYQSRKFYGTISRTQRGLRVQ